MASKDSVTTPRQNSGFAIHRSIICSKPIRDDPRCSHLLDGSIRFFLGDNAHAEIWPLDHGSQLAFTFTHPDHEGSSTLNKRMTTSISTCLALMKDWDPVLRAAVENFPSTHYWTILEDTVEAGWVSKGGKVHRILARFTSILSADPSSCRSSLPAMPYTLSRFVIPPLCLGLSLLV